MSPQVAHLAVIISGCTPSGQSYRCRQKLFFLLLNGGHHSIELTEGILASVRCDIDIGIVLRNLGCRCPLDYLRCLGKNLVLGKADFLRSVHQGHIQVCPQLAVTI